MTKPTFKLLTGAAVISKAIQSISTRGAKLDRDIQIAALSTMQHHADHGDVTLINNLVAAMPKGARSNALKQFIETFSAARYCEERKLFVHVKGKNHRISEGMEVMWHEFKPEQDYKSIDPVAYLASAIKRLEADMLKLGENSKVTPELIAGMKALANVTRQPEIAH